MQSKPFELMPSEGRLPNLKRKRRICGKANKTINHIVSEYSKLVQKEHKTSRDCIGRGIHWVYVEQKEFQ